MAGNTLILEGLPDDFGQISSKLKLYFENKRRSGGEIVQLQSDPADKRRARLIYLDNAALQKVLSTKYHQIDFKKPLGVVKLKVTLEENASEVKTAKPPVSPLTGLHAHKLLVLTEHKKDFLVMYFEQFATELSLTQHGKNSWILNLSSCSDVEKVLAKKVQDDYGISVSIYEERDVAVDPRRFVLTGFEDKCHYNMVSVYIGSCSQGADHVWETLDDGDSIVVTFKQDIDVENFMSKCSSKKCKDMVIAVSCLDMVDSVLVQGDLSKITDETLSLYFTSKRSKGGEIKSLKRHTNNKSVAITFNDCHIAQNVVEHKHNLSGVELVAQLFYSSFQKVLTGQKTKTDFATNVIIPVSKETLGFIHCNSAFKHELSSSLQKVHADVSIDLTSNPPHMELTVALDKACLGMLRLGHAWEKNAHREAHALLEKYKEIHVPTEGEIWGRVENSCLELISNNVSVSFNKSSSEIVVIGLQNEVKIVMEKIENMLKKANDELQTERDTAERKIQFKSNEELDFILDLISGKLAAVSITKDEGSFTINLRGLNNNVKTGERVIKETLDNLVTKTLNPSATFVEFMLSLDLKKFDKDHFAQNQISSRLIPTNKTLQILAEQDDLQKAEHKLNEVIKEEVLELTIEQAILMKSEHGRQFFEGLNADLESSCNHQNIRILLSDSKISVCGFSSVVVDVWSKVRGYLENKKPTTVVVTLKSLQEVEFLESSMHLSDAPKLKALGATILLNKTLGSHCLNVTAPSDQIKEATLAVKALVSGILTNTYTYCNAGECKVLKKNEVFLEAKAKELKCKLNLFQTLPINTLQSKFEMRSGITNLRNVNVTDSNAKGYFQSDVTGTGMIQHRAFKISLPSLLATSRRNPKLTVGRVSVTLKKGDIINETAEIIVNSTNQNLNLNSGVSGAILKAAGKSVVDQCKRMVGSVWIYNYPADGVVLTGGGNLKCKHIAHMVGPTNVSGITSSIEKVLQLCETIKTVTISIPTVGTGNGGIDPKHSVKAILQGVKNHMSKTTSNSIKIICIVAFEQKIFDVMQNYLDQKNRSQKIRQVNFIAKQMFSLILVRIHGVMIEVRQGNITNENVRGIVNTTNANFNLTGGVSAAIFQAAGNAVQQECQKICPLKGNEIAVTSGGNLETDFIFHMLGPHSVADATIRVTKALERCEEQKITTVSFPAVGTGGGGLKGIDSAGAILQGVADHLSQHPQTALKLMYIVIDQDNIKQEFLKGITQWKSNQGVLMMRTAAMNRSQPQMTKVTQAAIHATFNVDEISTIFPTMPYILKHLITNYSFCLGPIYTIEAMLGPVKVKVLNGDITQEKTDAIVSSTNTTLNLNTGVSGAILKAAGQTVVDECAALGVQPSNGVVMTKPGNLQAKHIIHMVGQTKEKDITSSTLKVLKMCVDNKIQSVSFPALGTGAGNLATAKVANAMLAAIEDLLLITRKPTVTTVHIVVFQNKIFKEFQEAIKKLKKISPKTFAFTTKRPAKTFFSTQATSVQKPSLCLASACRKVSFPVIEVVVLSCSTGSLDQIKKLMDDVISQECSSEDLTSNHLSLLQESEKQAIVALSQNNQVHVAMATPNKVTVSGKRDDVLSVVIQIKDFLQNARDRESRADEEKRLRETVRWEVGEGETWGELDQSLNLDLEVAFHGQQQAISYIHQGEKYTVDIKSMQQTDSKGTITRVKRTPKTDSETAVIQPPPSWTRMDQKELDIIDLALMSEEYKKVENEFIQTSKRPNPPCQATIQVVKIQRIQSKDQWQRYAVKKLALDKKYPTNKNELILYHGTTADICQKINTNGFNRSFCGKNATAYGNGTYFAKESWYSCQDLYSNPDPSGLKYIYRAKVLVGKPCLGTDGLKEPHPLNPKDPTAGLYDCAVNNLQHPFIYVVFLDAGAYPDYLITFKSS
ncbi:LOW QUALITY PROTEIN: protein mono-ADP-ribosyltransferase PARP14 [Aplochiton taeniatus]